MNATKYKLSNKFLELFIYFIKGRILFHKYKFGNKIHFLARMSNSVKIKYCARNNINIFETQHLIHSIVS